MSRVGVLVHTSEGAVAVSRPLKLRIALNVDGAPGGAFITCLGRLVRTERALGNGLLIAVAIDRVRIVPVRARGLDGSLIDV